MIIFNANIVWTYQSVTVLFPVGDDENGFNVFLIAWINLDFGIET